MLKGFDQLVNIVLDDCVGDARPRLSLLTRMKEGGWAWWCAGAAVSLVSPVDGRRDAHPFIQQEDEGRIRFQVGPGVRRRRGGAVVMPSGPLAPWQPSRVTVSASGTATRGMAHAAATEPDGPSRTRGPSDVKEVTSIRSRRYVSELNLASVGRG